MKIRLFITGGTIDKVYNQSNGELEFDQTHFPEILKRARIAVDLLIEELLLIDSLDMVDADRELILKKCVQCDERFILVTHGTDTMCETASYWERTLLTRQLFCSDRWCLMQSMILMHFLILVVLWVHCSC